MLHQLRHLGAPSLFTFKNGTSKATCKLFANGGGLSITIYTAELSCRTICIFSFFSFDQVTFCWASVCGDSVKRGQDLEVNYDFLNFAPHFLLAAVSTFAFRATGTEPYSCGLLKLPYTVSSNSRVQH